MTISSADSQEEEELFYELHRDELLATLRSGSALRLGLEPRAEAGVGILNQGATCYMNSLLQVLFYTPEFRLALYGFKYDMARHGSAARCIPLQMQLLFARMQLSLASAVSTIGLTEACGLAVGEQHDVQELCRVLFDALARSSPTIKNDMHRLYAGKVKHYIRTREAHHGNTFESSRTELFLDLQVPIMGFATLEQAIHNLTVPEVLDGDNQWECEELGSKVDALKGMEFIDLPHILHLQLLRFVFDLTSMSRKKLTDTISIPLELDLQHLLCSHVDSMLYELSGMCIQTGTAHSGHYVAKVRDTNKGEWVDANDAVLRTLDREQLDGLFKRRDGSTGGAGPVDAQLALNSSDAYYLVYRRVTLGKPFVRDSDVPDQVATTIHGENERLKTLQQTYCMHKALLEIVVFEPCAAVLALRRYVEQKLDGLVPKAELLTGAVESQSVTVHISKKRSVSYALQKALGVFVARAEEGKAFEWARALDIARPNVARLRRYEYKWGYIMEPLDMQAAIEECLAVDVSLGKATVILELSSSVMDFDERGFESWQPEKIPLILCRWDHSSGGLRLSEGDLRILRLSSHPTPSDTGGREGPCLLAAKESAQSYDPDADELPDLFAEFQDASPVRSPDVHGSVLVRHLREVAAANWGEYDVAIVPMSGASGGQSLEDEFTLQTYLIDPLDVLCVETIVPGFPLQAMAFYESVKNTTHLFFNHPDRDMYTEEFKLSICKRATVIELKVEIAKALGLDAEDLHLRREKGKPQLKDESKTLSMVGLAESTSVFVGRGAPCQLGYSMLCVYLYRVHATGAVELQEVFNFASDGGSTVKQFKEALIAPIKKWAAGKCGALEPLCTEPLTWKRLRLRDAQAGKQDAILRDEKTLRSALLGFADGRQVAFQVLDHEEELLPDEALVVFYPWLVNENRLLASFEVIVNKRQTLENFRKVVEARLSASLEGGENNCAVALALDISGLDELELALLPFTRGAVSIKQCACLKWTDCRLNTDKIDALAKPLTELREVRDGVAVVVRSKLDAAKAAASEMLSGGKSGSGKGPPLKGANGCGNDRATKSAASKSEATSIAEGVAVRAAKSAKALKARTQERGLNIEVVCPIDDTQDMVD